MKRWALSAGLLIAAPFAAAGEAPGPLEDRLRTLESRVNTLERENADLRIRLGAGGTAPAAGVVAPAGTETRLALGGFTQAQAEFGDAGDARFAGTADRIFIRRARLYLLAGFAGNFEAKIEGEFGAGSFVAATGLRAQANEIYLGWNRYREASVRIGQLKPAYCTELLAVEYKNLLVERSLGAERIGDSRQVGVSVYGELPALHAGYAVVVANGTGYNSSTNDNSKFQPTARVYVTPLESQTAGSLTLGADALHATDAGVNKPGFNFDAVPGGATDNLFTGGRDAWGVDAAWHCGLLDVSTELLRMRFRPADRLPDRAFTAEGWQMTAAYFLLPHQLQAVVRREHFDPNISRRGDSTDNWLIGFGLYFKGDDIRLMTDYLFGRAAGLPEDHGRWLTRLQIIY